MILLISLITILQSMSIALGVGSSTLAIINFFVAIADGVIDETERRMMGVVYIVLRVAMVLILLTTATLIYLNYGDQGILNLPGVAYSQLTVLFILYLNATLMTKHLMPSTFGPAIQAGSWYALGAISALQIIGKADYYYWHFLLGFVTWIVLAVGIVNGVMAILKALKQN